MAKQVNSKVVGTIVEGDFSNPGANSSKSEQRNLFVKVDTYNADNELIGERVVDMYHFGTRNWLQSHHWWAMHNAHTVETRVASPDEIDDYVASQKAALAAKFAPDLAHEAA